VESNVTVEELSPNRFQVTIRDGGSSTTHTVRVSPDDLKRWARGKGAATLVRRSFEFLLEREPKESILREFDLSVIQRYFPEYDGAMRGTTS
jgi:hypothetical protein